MNGLDNFVNRKRTFQVVFGLVFILMGIDILFTGVIRGGILYGEQKSIVGGASIAFGIYVLAVTLFFGDKK